MAQILTLKEKQPDAGKIAEICKCIFIETTESNRMWSVSIIWLWENELKQAEYLNISSLLKVFEIIKHEETPDIVMSFERMREILAPENIQIPEKIYQHQLICSAGPYTPIGEKGSSCSCDHILIQKT